MKKPLRVFVGVLVVCALALLPASVFAQSGKQVVVIDRDAEITILQNGDLQFVETWVVDFQYGSFTFAFREIPKDRLREIADWTVTEGSATLRTDQSESNNKTKFTWFFPPTNQGAKFFSDTHTFVLHYTVRGATRIYPAGDQLWWKFVEKDRTYPIGSARVRVHLPSNFSTNSLKTTTYLNSVEGGGGHILDGQTLEYIGGPFPPQTEWEIRSQFPHVITAPPEEWQQWDDHVAQVAAQNNVYALIAGILLLLGGPLFLLGLWYLFGRDKPTTFHAEFLNAPPDDTPPGVVGTLLDERADLQDIVATVADLAGRGYLRIRESDAFGTPEYERTAKSDSDLASFEKATLDALLRGMTMRRLDDVRGSFYAYLKDLQNALFQEVVSRGYFPDNPLAMREVYFKIGKIGALVVPTLGLGVYCVTFIFAPLALFLLIALEFLFIELLALSRVMPQRTPAGATAYAKWSAFKRYLASVEKYTTVSTAQEQFSKYLPYTIAFGLEKSWIEKFKQTTTLAPTWYIPYAPSTPSSDNWTWRDVGQTQPTDESRTGSGGSISSPGTLSINPSTPIFSDQPSDGSAQAPSLNQMADSSFLALNNASSNVFGFLNTSAEAFTTKPATRSGMDNFLDNVGGVLNWLASSSGSSSSGSSSSSSSSGGWSGGGSSGGGGGGGGSSGFG